MNEHRLTPQGSRATVTPASNSELQKLFGHMYFATGVICPLYTLRIHLYASAGSPAKDGPEEAGLTVLKNGMMY